MARFEKDFRHLCRQIDSLSAGQARVNVDNIFDPSDSSSDGSTPGSSFYVEITPRDGPYAHASFVFYIEASLEPGYPEQQPVVSCLTRVYHPNIDTQHHNHYDNVCVSTLSDWDGGVNCTLDALVQSLLFLFYSPNLDDPLTSDVSSDEVQFLANVRIAIEGGTILDFELRPFKMNYGYERYLMEQEQQEQLNNEPQLSVTLLQPSIEEPNEKMMVAGSGFRWMIGTLESAFGLSLQSRKEMPIDSEALPCI